MTHQGMVNSPQVGTTPGWPHCKWINHVQTDDTPPPVFWKNAIGHIHREATLRPLLATRWQR